MAIPPPLRLYILMLGISKFVVVSFVVSFDFAVVGAAAFCRSVCLHMFRPFVLTCWLACRLQARGLWVDVCRIILPSWLQAACWLADLFWLACWLSGALKCVYFFGWVRWLMRLLWLTCSLKI